MTAFGRRLAELLASRKITVYELGQRTGVDRKGLARILRGETRPSWEAAEKIAAALGVSLDEFRDAGVELPDQAARRPAGNPQWVAQADKSAEDAGE